MQGLKDAIVRLEYQQMENMEVHRIQQEENGQSNFQNACGEGELSGDSKNRTLTIGQGHPMLI
jgi:hypothetical protein